MKKRVLINGFGRIGRSVLRALTTNRADPDIMIVGVNDIADPHELAYLFQYDSVFGRHPEPVSSNGHKLTVGSQSFKLFRTSDLSKLALDVVDCVMECTGRGADPLIAKEGLDAGANKVLISGPSAAADLTLILGANTEQLSDQRVISLGSCTTNAIAPILALLHDTIGLTSAHITTIHCYTASQPSIDTPRGGFERSRAAAVSMVPTTTSASRLIADVLPDLGFTPLVSSVRVPTPSVSCIDLVASPSRSVTAEALNALIERGCSPILGTTADPVVSCDMAMLTQSLIVATPQTQASPGLVRVFGWYDNEWAFAHRMIDALKLI